MENINRNSNSYANFWRFIEEFLPEYYTRNDVLQDNILLRYIEGDDLSEMDLEWMKENFGNDKRSVIDKIVEMETQFCNEALKFYYNNKV